MNILFIIHTDDRDKLEFLQKLADSFVRKGAKVNVFLMSRGVKSAHMWSNLKTSLCSRNAEEFGIKDTVPVEFASQYKLSEMIEEAQIIIPVI